MNAIGTHLLIELRSCNELLLNDVQHIQDAMVCAAEQAGAKILAQSFHKFEPSGVTGIVAISESHLCIHTWPEQRYAAADIFTCGMAFKPHRAADLIIASLGCEKPSISEIQRGLSVQSRAAVF